MYHNMYDGYGGPSSNQMEAVLRLLRQVIGRESQDEVLLDYVIGMSRDETSERLIYGMRTEERTQYDTLKQIYEQLSGRAVQIETPDFSIPDTFSDAMGYMLERKARTVQLYTYLYMYVPNQYQPVIYPFISEEHLHMHKLNYLLIRHIQN
ncbi:hypothetical protein CR205_14495 [Alteribacter lacisalsi]|uniref:Uncharacterized protein n=1 Tax=Alteribacter lacisalsi TaxID=2045244 RepID=A0A2W0H4X1_9BACI|nr:hypothetical protein [Alteribacter lacisalsi]PYZ96883.1 hypothetical protein CR205_14495 [Alteribacter lacisalsi]